MGGEPVRKRKHLLFFGACCIVVVVWISGCACIPERWNRARSTTPTVQGAEGLNRAKRFFAQQDYTASLQEAEKVLKTHYGVAGDHALFQIGLIWACAGNPDRDYRKALDAFDSIIAQFPTSPLQAEADAMDSLIRLVLAKDEKILDLQKENTRLTKGLKKEKERAETLEEKNGLLVTETEELKGQLLKFKEIDLGMEEEKNETLRPESGIGPE